MTTPSKPRWFKSSYSGGSGTECVECARVTDGTLVRDSKDPVGAVIFIGGQAWCTFIRALDQGGVNGHP
ncbi:DUF397 domain-containing protein [Streptomyces cavernae]|uniref:DUF397 domain-containing protein n=1 Tax=Streptomyces cavernae TaxID=2259034 RepID=UPI000FEB6B8E|nr:DUF397 domain-containing protein [Streptomyces cavernae]